MSQKITVDPVTRIEGHLRIDVEVDNGSVQKAWSSGQMWRGIETILQGRDPRDAWLFTQRFCGVCTTVHAIASVRAVENAVGLEIPKNAQYIRNIIMSAHAMHDHIVHFYHLSALDWVDVVSALQADPAKAAQIAQSLGDWPGNSKQQMAAVKQKLESFVQAGQLGIFTNGYWGHPAMKLDPEVNLLAVAHYLQALEIQKKANQVVAILGSKTPNIQNLAVGGVANAINLDNEATLNMTKLYMVKDLLNELDQFISQVYIPDVCAIGAMYADWLPHGHGVTNYLSVPDMPLDEAGTEFDFPGGTIMNGDLSTFKEIENFQDPYFNENVTENIERAWYDGEWTRHPYEEDTTPKFSDFDPDGRYSWIKAPRFGNEVMEVGPLAQVLVGLAAGHEMTEKWATTALDKVSSLAGTQVPLSALHGTIGRHAARAIRAGIMNELSHRHWDLLVNNIASGDVEIFNEPVFTGRQTGCGFHEAPRGALSHFVVIDNGKITNYQAVVPSTWNAGPRDGQDRPGPYEAALVGNPIADPEQPLEVLRTVHSFDPCIACAVHTLDIDGTEVSKVQAL
jgi:hydrogenase large subunit